MAHGRMFLLAATLGAAILASCGGQSAPGATGTPSVTQGGGGGATAGPGATATGGGGENDPCALLTADEVAGATATSEAVTAAGTAGDPAKCTYSLADGTQVILFDLIHAGSASFFQTFVDAGSGESVDGIGDQAYYEPGTRRLLVMSGEYVVMLSSGPFVDGADLDGMAAIAVARLSGGSVPPGGQITPPPVVSAETACDLLSGDEAAGVVGKGPMEAQANPDALQFCTYAVVSSGEVALSVYFQRSGAAASFDSYSSSAEPVAGLGDRAMFEASTGILFVLKGDSMFNVNVYLPNSADALEPDRQLAAIMLGHL